MSVRGKVINIHSLGATVRLEDGRLASIPRADVEANQTIYSRALGSRTPLPFDELRTAKHVVATLVRNEVNDTVVPTSRAPEITNALFEAHMTAYLKDTEEWMPPDRPTPIERHFIRKHRRAAQFSQERS
ncbi:MAG TPA: hypothetical protein VN603_03225 [Candidatus Acidoferrales bacterium]|nr:hypothetical protein [Candidatus Acidoferrales bacterium]